MNYDHLPWSMYVCLGPEHINSTLGITAKPAINPHLAYLDLEVHLLHDPRKQSHAGAEGMCATYCSGFKNGRCLLSQTFNSPTCCLFHEISALQLPSSVSAFEQVSRQTPLGGSHLNYYLLVTPQCQ